MVRDPVIANRAMVMDTPSVVQNVGNGPTVRVSSSYFGNMDLTFDIHTNRQSLKALGEMFLKAAEATYSEEEYCHVAKVDESINEKAPEEDPCPACGQG